MGHEDEFLAQVVRSQSLLWGCRGVVRYLLDQALTGSQGVMGEQGSVRPEGVNQEPKEPDKRPVNLPITDDSQRVAAGMQPKHKKCFFLRMSG